MKRRDFFKLSSGVIVPLAWQPERAYSFLWAPTDPLVAAPVTAMWLRLLDAAGNVLADSRVEAGAASGGTASLRLVEPMIVGATGRAVSAALTLPDGAALPAHLQLSCSDLCAGQTISLAGLTITQRLG